MQDPEVTLVEFIKANYSSSNPTATQISGRIYTSPSERTMQYPSLVIGPMPEGPESWLSALQIHYKSPCPITAYATYDPNPLNFSSSESNAKIMRWNMIDSCRNLIAGNKNLSSDGKIQVVYNKGTPRKVNLTKWRPPVVACVSTVIVEWADDLTRSGVIP